MRKFIEKLVEGGFLISGSVSSFTILLIIVFLFKEAAGLFNSPEVKEGYILAVNQENPVEHLSPEQIMDVFDANITNWEDLNGENQDILVFRFSDLTNYYTEEELGEEFQYVPEKINELIHKEPGIIAFFPEQYKSENFTGKIISGATDQTFGVLWRDEMVPTSAPAPIFGLIPLITRHTFSKYSARLAYPLPFGVAVAIYMAEIANTKTRNLLKPIIELLAGIPSVVYGFFGLVVIVPLIQKTLDLPVGETAFAGSVVLAIMALPTIITVAEDAMRTTPRAMKEASLALGATQWQTIYKVIIPYSISGITSAVVLGIGRAIGETMAVLMVTGNAAVIPTSFFEPVRTIPATIAAELGEAPAGGAHYQALFMLGAVLFLITLGLSIAVEYISSKRKI